MKIELKNIKINESFSQETTCFRADLYVDGVKVGGAENDGGGGNTNVYYNGPADKVIFEQAVAYCKSTPKLKSTIEGMPDYDMDLEMFVDNLVWEEEKRKQEKKIINRIAKECAKSIVYGVKGAAEYKVFSWKGHTIESIKKHPQGMAAIEKALIAIKAKLQPNETIFNTNLEL